MKFVMETFYHGSSHLFDQFSLSHALEGAGKVKFGYGVYVTSQYSSAKHYAEKYSEGGTIYVYTVEVPEKREDNYIDFKEPVKETIVARAMKALNEEIPEKAVENGKVFRKYIAKRLTGNVDFEGEIAASAFLLGIGVEMIIWPYNWRKPALGSNRAILRDSDVRIVKVDGIKREEEVKTNFYSVAPFIKEFYPQYYSIESYPAAGCVTIRKVKEEWGVLGNFATTPLLVHGVLFKSAERLFQCLKFKDKAAADAVYNAANPKMTAKHWEKKYRREDWGRIIVDVMKFCLQTKYEQSEEFRRALSLTQGKYIVEDQTSFPKKNADTWGVKLVAGKYVGPNLLGRLLMELRDNEGKLEYCLPPDIFK